MKKSVIVVFTLLLLGATLWSINLPIVVAGLFLLYRASGRFLDTSLFDSKLYRLVVVLFVYTLLLGAVISAATLLWQSFSIVFTPALLLATILATQLLVNTFFKTSPKSSLKSNSLRKINGADVASIVAVIVIIAATIVPPFISSGFHKVNVISAVYGGVDDTVHLAILNDRLEFKRGVFLDNSIAARASDKTSYPAAWHSANATLVLSVAPTIQPGLSYFLTYVFLKIMWYGIMLFFMLRLVYTLMHRKHSKALYYTLSAIGIIVGGVLGITQFFYGFFAFFPQVISLLIISALLIQVRLSRKTQPETILLLAIVAILGGMTWILLLPAILLAILVTLLRVNSSVMFWINAIKVSLFKYWMFYVLAFATLIQTIWLAGFSSEPSNFSKDILLGGGVAVYVASFYCVLIAGIASYFMVKHREHNLQGYYWLNIFLLLTALLFLAIQLNAVGEPRYYFYKTMVALCMTITPLSIAGIGLLLEKVSRNRTIVIACLSIIVVPLITIVIGPVPSSVTDTTSYLKGDRPYSAYVRDDVYSYLKTPGAYDDKSYRLYLNEASQMESFYTTMLAKSVKPGSECFFESRKSVVAGDLNIDSLMTQISQYCQGYTITIVSPSVNLIGVNHTPKNVLLHPY